MKEVVYKEIQNIKCNQGSLRAVRFNVDGDYLLSAGADRTLKLWSAERGILLSVYSGHSGEVLDCRGSCDNAQLLSASNDKTSGLWDVESGRSLRRFRAHAAAVTTSVFNEEATLVISGSQDNTVKIFDLRSKSNTTPIQTIEEMSDGITSLAINNNGILIGSADSFVRFYDIRNGKMSENCMGEAVSCVAISRDNASHLAAVGDGSCKLMDRDTGQLLASYKGYSTEAFHDYKVESSFDFMDELVLVGSPLGKVCIFDLISEKMIKEIPTQFPVVSLTCHGSRDRFGVAAGGQLILYEGDLSR